MLLLFVKHTLAIVCISLLISCSTDSDGTNKDTFDIKAVGDNTNTKANTKTIPDFSKLTTTQERKQAFFAFIQPLVLTSNQEILHLRKELLIMDADNLTAQQKQRLANLSSSYQVKTDQPVEQLAELLVKVRPIPVSLVMAQAANESAWGASRFAKQGNNLFGQWCFKVGCGIVPSDRGDGNHEVKVFKTPQNSVASYIHNLNSHPSYKTLRKIRSCLIAQHQRSTGRDLSNGLMHYSSRGIEYIKEIQELIRYNKLEKWQDNWWGYDKNHACNQFLPSATRVL